MWVLLMAYKLFDSNGKYQIVFLTSSYHITQNNEVTQHTFNPKQRNNQPRGKKLEQTIMNLHLRH